MNRLVREISIHGLKFLLDSRVNKIVRGFWALVMLVSVSGLVLYVLGIYAKFNVEPEMSERIRLRPSGEIPFPAVTICDPTFARDNLINYPELVFNKRNRIPYQLSPKEQNFYSANGHACLPNARPQMRDFVNQTDFDIVRLLRESSLDVDEVFVLCSFQKTLTYECESMFNKILTDYGYCFSVNMQGYESLFNAGTLSADFDCYRRRKITRLWLSSDEKFRVNDESENVSWTLDSGFLVEQADDFIPKRAIKKNFVHAYLFISDVNAENFCPQIGQVFKVIFHLPSEIPTFLHEEFSIEFGHHKTMFLQATAYKSDESIRRFSPDQRRCYFERERALKFFKSYTKSHCDLECVTNYTLALCGCVKFSMPRTVDTPICDITRKRCYYEAMLTWPNNRSHYGEDEVPCRCYRTCNDIQYGISYEDDALFNSFNSVAHLNVADNGSISLLRMSFRSHLVEVHEKYAGYKIHNFIADFGGLLGLFLGCSLLSIAEVFFLLIHFLMKSTKIKDTRESLVHNHNSRRQILQVISLEDDFGAKPPHRSHLQAEFQQLSAKLNRLERRLADMQIPHNPDKTRLSTMWSENSP